MPEDYYPPTEAEGGWRTATPDSLGVDVGKLKEAYDYHDNSPYTKGMGGALLVVYKGHIIGESYVTGKDGGPQPWKPTSCNDVKSSTKSVFGTAVGVFLDEYKDKMTLDSLLVGYSKEESLIPYIWGQPLTDERKKKIMIKNAISMTSGHETPEPWVPPSHRHHYKNHTGPMNMYEYCFGWWYFDGVSAQHTLIFEPGTDFNYSNYGLEMTALAMRDISGERMGPYVYDRVLGKIGMDKRLRDNQYKHMVYNDPRELNFSDEPGWGVGGGEGCNAYGADESESPIGYNTIAGSTFRCTPRDYARLAYLWLRKGKWNGEQLVPEEWLDVATKRFVRDDGSTPSPYGYTWWVMDEWEHVPKDCFASRGHNMNDSYTIPSLDLVIVRMGNDNPARGKRVDFIETVVSKIVAAIPK
jgi:CubicO group peptidase (beta-lactamase class C family)